MMIVMDRIIRHNENEKGKPKNCLLIHQRFVLFIYKTFSRWLYFLKEEIHRNAIFEIRDAFLQWSVKLFQMCSK